MKIFRYPLTKTVEALKTVTLYQAPRESRYWMTETHVGNYMPLHHMESVFCTRMSGSYEDILGNCFEEFNAVDDATSMLNHSMSVGDVVCIDGHMFRCLPHGWVEIGRDIDGEVNDPFNLIGGDIDARDIGF